MTSRRKTFVCVSALLAALVGCAAPSNTVSRDTDAPIIAASLSSKTARPALSGEIPMTVYLTGYSYWDNTPRGSAAIAHPVVRRQAGGSGTYSDPITIAVGHVKKSGRSKPDYRPGTKFYVKNLRKYAIVEDVCGDGPKPQNGPCHTGYKGYPWLDIWVGGEYVQEATVDRCMYRLTGLQTLIKNPKPTYPVVPGEISASGCKVYK